MKHKRLRKILIFVFMLCLVFANATCFASATDPVSAATMANALAQAITAYGATQGVSMTFDVADSSGIGEGMHELWDQFVEDVNDPNTPTYDSLAVTMWSNMYSKIGNNLGINISSSDMPFIDSFWNWLLSGPAEMTKVDNEYYEWTVVNNTVVPINILSNNGLVYLPSLSTNASLEDICNNGIWIYEQTIYGQTVKTYMVSLESNVYMFLFGNDLSGVGFVSSSSGTVKGAYNSDTYHPAHNLSLIENNGVYYTSFGNSRTKNTAIPSFSTLQDGIDHFTGTQNGTIPSDNISVRPYIGDATPQNVYIPDNNDVNYNPTDVAIPLDIPWDNTLFGDGNGVLTDAQSEAAASAADDDITDSVEKTLTIVNTDNPDIPANEVYIPFLPLTLPSFNFSLSGIWHYVVTWVSSLGDWFTTMFQIWSILPYAMVVPVYATLVVVIVLGVYRRFLS